MDVQTRCAFLASACLSDTFNSYGDSHKMTMNMQYTVVSGSDEESLRIGIEQFLSQGWMLQGGVSVCSYVADGDTLFIYAQAMTKEHGQGRSA
jgi:hypothetical protein